MSDPSEIADEQVRARSAHQVRDRQEARRAIEFLEQSQSWGYEDRDLLCRLLRYLVKVSRE